MAGCPSLTRMKLISLPEREIIGLDYSLLEHRIEGPLQATEGSNKFKFGKSKVLTRKLLSPRSCPSYLTVLPGKIYLDMINRLPCTCYGQEQSESEQSEDAT